MRLLDAATHGMALHDEDIGWSLTAVDPQSWHRTQVLPFVLSSFYVRTCQFIALHWITKLERRFRHARIPHRGAVWHTSSSCQVSSLVRVNKGFVISLLGSFFCKRKLKFLFRTYLWHLNRTNEFKAFSKCPGDLSLVMILSADGFCLF